MRLIKVEIAQYKRFREPACMDADPTLVCIVGPNAAGKSSFLDALVHLNHEGPFDQREGTRSAGSSAAPRVAARFLVEKEDRDLLAEIPEARTVRQLVLTKHSDGSREYELVPDPQRDRRPRVKAHDKLVKLNGSAWFKKETDRENDAGTSELDDCFNAASQAVGADSEFLTEAQREQVGRLRDRLREAGIPATATKLGDELEALLDHDARDPSAEAGAVLLARLPKFEKFESSSRELQAAYDVHAEPDMAIRNLLALAETTFIEARTIAEAGDPGRKVSWLERTNERLRESITKAWNQSDLTVHLDLDGTTLAVLMTMHERDYVQIDQHSDGLRQFVALRAFIAIASGHVKPIVLIDEADTHLHYDAQADLVRVLEEQREAAKVIYTTHSAGCLPRDLGTAVRAIVPVYTDEDTPRPTDDSAIRNNFWTAEGHGFSPLLLAMGASAFAFAATQRAVIGEGMSDVLLYPTLIREARDSDSVGYQVTPGFSEARRADVPTFDLLAARVAFLADGDDGGGQHAKKLEAGGVLSDQIVFLGGPNSGLAVEDLLVRDVYLQAVNDELERWFVGLEMPDDALPDIGRSRAVADWCKTQKASDGGPVELSKVRIAERVLDLRAEARLLDPSHRDTVRVLDKALAKVLDTATSRLAR